MGDNISLSLVNDAQHKKKHIFPPTFSNHSHVAKHIGLYVFIRFVQTKVAN